MPRTILVAPAGRAVGLTTSTLGLIRAFDRQGGRVAFAKPIGTRSDDRSVALVALGSPLRPPSPIARAEVNDLLAAGDEQTLLERVVALCAQAAEGADVLVVEGMIPEDGMAYAMRVNQLMIAPPKVRLRCCGCYDAVWHIGGWREIRFPLRQNG